MFKYNAYYWTWARIIFKKLKLIERKNHKLQYSNLPLPTGGFQIKLNFPAFAFACASAKASAARGWQIKQAPIEMKSHTSFSE